MAHPVWPLFDLRVRTGRIEIRLPSDEDLVALAKVAAEGIHDPVVTPFLRPWTDAPSPDLERSVLQWSWLARAQWSAEEWRFAGGVFVDGEAVGIQGIEAQHFGELRSVSTGSWLGRRYQGKGIGTEMRVAILHLAFVGLNAKEAHSGAWWDNEVSLRLSRSLGYQDNGLRAALRRDKPDTEILLRLDRDTWETVEHPPVTIEGLDGCRELFNAEL
jgi:RimJ/RimL family protein N-acetyltransferase